ncbi:MAG: hypothetical protein V4700_04840 [Pseudomonadota bacterium]
MPGELIDIKLKDSSTSKTTLISVDDPLCYSLERDKKNKEKEVLRLDRQISIVDALISKADNTRYTELVAKKESCELKKEILQKFLFEIDSIHLIAKESLAYFEFIEDLDGFSIDLLCFCSEGKRSIRKALDNLKKTEESLVQFKRIEEYLSKGLNDLHYDVYQGCLEVFCSSFFLNFTPSPDVFSKYIFLAKKIRTCFFMHFVSILNDNFHLEETKKILQDNIFGCELPTCEHSLIGLFIYFFYNILLEFIQLQPIRSNSNELEASVRFYLKDLPFSMAEDNIVYKVYNLEKKIAILEKETIDFFGKNGKFSKKKIDTPLVFFNKKQKEIVAMEEYLKNLVKNKKNIGMIQTLFQVLSKEKKENLLSGFKNNIGLDFSLIKENNLDIYHIEDNKEILQYFFYCICTGDTRDVLFEKIQKLMNTFSTENLQVSLSPIEQFTLQDFIALGHAAFSCLLYSDVVNRFINFKNQLIYFKLCETNILLFYSLKAINELYSSVLPKTDSFLQKNYSIQGDFIKDKKEIVDELELLLSPIGDALELLNDVEDYQRQLLCQLTIDGVSYLSLAKKKFSEFLKTDNKDSRNNAGSYDVVTLLDVGDLQKVKKELGSKKELIAAHLFSESARDNANIVRKKDFSATKDIGSKREKIVSFIDVISVPLESLCKNISMSLNCVKEYGYYKKYKKKNKLKKKDKLKERFSSVIGQIHFCFIRLTEAVPSLTSDVVKESPSSLLMVLNQINNFIQTLPNNAEKKNSNLVFLKDKIDEGFLFFEIISKNIIELTEKYNTCKTKIEALLDKLHFLLTPNLSSFFDAESLVKEIEKIFNGTVNLKQQFFCLQELAKVIRYESDGALSTLYNLISQQEQYEAVLHCLKQQVVSLRKESKYIVECKSLLPVSVANVELLETEVPVAKKNEIQLSKQYLQDTKKNRIENPEDRSVNEFKFNELNKLKAWDNEFEKWKVKKDSALASIFYAIEQCSIIVLTRTIPAFLKILHCYAEDLSIKKTELKAQQHRVDVCFLEIDANNPIKNYLFQNEQWFESLLARIDACIKFLHACLIKNNQINSDNSENINQSLQFLHSPRPPEFDRLLASYLGSVVTYNKTKETLIHEENKLSNLNRRFISGILLSGSFELIEKQNDLIIQFNEQIKKVNQLTIAIKQEYEYRQEIKAQLALIVDPNSLNFYISRIDPNDTQILEANSYQLSAPAVASAYTFCPSSFYFINPANPCMPSNNSFPPNLVYYGV